MLVHKYSYIFHCFLLVNHHIDFQSPNLQFLMINNHWFKVIGIMYCSACPHFTKWCFPFASPALMLSKNLMVSTFLNTIISLFFPDCSNSTGQNSPSGLLCLIDYSDYPVSHIFSQENRPPQSFLHRVYLAKGDENFSGPEASKKCVTQTRPSHPHPLPTPIFPFQKLLPAFPQL